MTATKLSEKAKKPIPEFTSLEEEAAFWDTHDTTEYLDNTPVQGKIADDFKSIYVKGTKVKDAIEEQMRRSTQGVTVRFQPNVLAELRRRAAQKGIGATTLVRMWVLEHLHQEEKNHSWQSS